MVLACRGICIHGMLFVGYIWPVYLGLHMVNKSGICCLGAWLPAKYQISYVTV